MKQLLRQTSKSIGLFIVCLVLILACRETAFVPDNHEKPTELKSLPNAHSGPGSTCAPIRDGLVGWWPGNNHSRDLANRNHGILQGDAGYEPGVIGSAFSFDGDGDYVEIPNSPQLNPGEEVSVAFWMKGDPNNPMAHCCQGLVISDFYGLEIAPGSGSRTGVIMLAFTEDGFVHSSDRDDGGFPVKSGIWYHFVGTYDGENVSLYSNGELVQQASNSGRIHDMKENSFLGIGTEDGRTNEPGLFGWRYFHGIIEEAGVWNRALEPDEIRAMANCGATNRLK